jgi:hypothetical protein
MISGQFRTVEVPSLEEIHGQLEYLGFARGKFELFAAFGRGAGGADLFPIRSSRNFPLDDNPSPTLRAGHARAHNAIRHFIQCK